MMANKITALVSIPLAAATIFGGNWGPSHVHSTPPDEVVPGGLGVFSVFMYQLANYSTSSDLPGIELRTTGDSQSIPKNVKVLSIALPLELSCEFWKESDSQGTALNKVDSPGLNDTSHWSDPPDFFLCVTTGGSSASGTSTNSQTAGTSSTGATSSAGTTASSAITGSSTASSATDSTLASRTAETSSTEASSNPSSSTLTTSTGTITTSSIAGSAVASQMTTSSSHTSYECYGPVSNSFCECVSDGTMTSTFPYFTAGSISQDCAYTAWPEPTTIASRPTLLSCSATTSSVSSDTASATMCACTSDNIGAILSTIPGNSGDAKCAYAFWPSWFTTTAFTTETTSLLTTPAAPASAQSSPRPSSTNWESVTCSVFGEATSFCNCLSGSSTVGVFSTLPASDDASKCAYTAPPTSTSSTTTTTSAAPASTESSVQATSTPTETTPSTTTTTQAHRRRNASPRDTQPPLLCTPMPSILPQLSTNLVTYTWTNIPPTSGLGSAVYDSACGFLTEPAALNPPTRAVNTISTTCAEATLVIPTLTPPVAVVKGGGTVEYSLFCTVNSERQQGRRWELRTENSKAEMKTRYVGGDE